MTFVFSHRTDHSCTGTSIINGSRKQYHYSHVVIYCYILTKSLKNNVDDKRTRDDQAKWRLFVSNILYGSRKNITFIPPHSPFYCFLLIHVVIRNTNLVNTISACIYLPCDNGFHFGIRMILTRFSGP